MLDLRALALIVTVSGVVFFLATVTIWRLAPEERNLRAWAASSMLAALSFLLFGLRGTIPDFLSIVIGNTTLLQSLAYMHAGTRGLLGLKETRPWYWVATPALFVALNVFTYTFPDVS
ncbi:MAG TPA: hypothetical protein VK832_10790, partial [Burkholderiaceae bacterium]|nr:hypothetical protein [Burkholderiaceae bacterium]